jgi:hypothetical protein
VRGAAVRAAPRIVSTCQLIVTTRTEFHAAFTDARNPRALGSIRRVSIRDRFGARANGGVFDTLESSPQRSMLGGPAGRRATMRVPTISHLKLPDKID